MAKHQTNQYSQAQHQSGQKFKILRGARHLLFELGECCAERDMHGFATGVLPRSECNQTVFECYHLLFDGL